MLVNVTCGTMSLEKPGPQPLRTAIVESPTRIIRTGGNDAGESATVEKALNIVMAEKRICTRITDSHHFYQAANQHQARIPRHLLRFDLFLVVHLAAGFL